MKTLINNTLRLACFLWLAQPAYSDISISVSFEELSNSNSSSIIAGTSTIDFYLRFDAVNGPLGNDAGASLTGFTYAIEATSSSTVFPKIEKPITANNLASSIRDWNFSDMSADGADNQVAGNVNAPPSGAESTTFPFGNTVMSFKLATGALLAGDQITINPNLFQLAAVSSGANSFGGNANYTFVPGTLRVTSVPEPTAIWLLVPAIACGLFCRRARYRR